MEACYPIILSFAENGDALVYIPDFSINTQGRTIYEAMEMARDAIGICGIDMEDEGEQLPTPSDLKAIKRCENELVLYVDINFTEYRRQNDLRTVRKNCTIPSWLNSMAEKAGINFSAVLQDGLKRELRIVK